MGSVKIILCVAITFFGASEAAYCTINDQINSCIYTITCIDKTGSVSVPPCNYASIVKFVITRSNLTKISAGFFGATNFDSKVRSIQGFNNTWTTIDTSTFMYYKEAISADFSGNNVKNIFPQAFKNLDSLLTLNLSSNAIESFGPETFYVADNRGLNVQTLDLSHNRLRNLSTELSRLVKLTNLYLEGNSLHTLDSRCFSALMNLQELNLGHNELNSLNRSLTNTKNLTTFDICYNYLTELSSNETMGLSNLQSFNASHNSITSIQFDYFTEARMLGVLDLSFNNISTPIKNEMFKFNTKLIHVDFYNNNIPEFDENVFANDALIASINIDKNNLTGALTSKTFAGLKGIIKLDITNQSITSLEDKSFEGMTKLQYLNLTRNKISEIANTSFGNTSIMKLDLSHNQLRKLNFLKDLSNLIELYLNNNNLTIVPRLTFFGQSKLKVLDLSMNMIVVFEELSLPLVDLQYLNITGNRLTGSIPKNVFSPAKFLRFLDVNNFNITKIESMAFANLPNMARLNLSHNQIDFIDPNNFIGVNNMYSLDISHNRLKRLAFNGNVLSNLKAIYLNNNELTNLTFPGANKLLYLDLSKNNIRNVIGVGAEMFPNLTVLRLSNNQIINFNNPHTNTLTSLVDLQLSSNNLTDITLKYFKELMTVNLSNNSISRINMHFFENVDYIQALDLSRNNISELPPGTFQNMKNLKLLNLSSNYISKLSYGSLTGLHKTELLDLSKNNISYLEVDVLHECGKLSTLILDYNHLTTLDVATLTNKYLFNLKILSMGHNPISCREVVLNARYARGNKVEVTAMDKVYHEDNVHGIKCGNDLNSTTDNVTNEDASFDDVSIILLAFTVIMIILIVTIVVVYLKVFKNSRFVTINQPSIISSLEMDSTDMSSHSLI